MTGYWLLIFVLLILYHSMIKRRQAAVLKCIARRRKGRKIMDNEIVRRFVGKTCDVYSMMSSLEAYHGVITEVSDNWMIVTEDKSEAQQLINLDYVVKIKEYPEKKKK